MLSEISKSSETKGNLSKAYHNLIKEIFDKMWQSDKEVCLKNRIKVTPDQFHNIIGYYNPQFQEIGANDSKDLLIEDYIISIPIYA